MVLLGVAVFPILGLGGMQLFKAEAPGPMKDKLTPRIAETAKILWILYLGVTVAEAILLRLGGMSLFDSVCHSMSTISTGGFSPHDRSLGYYNSGFIHVVTTGFMLLGGMTPGKRTPSSGRTWASSPSPPWSCPSICASACPSGTGQPLWPSSTPSFRPHRS
jgi:hypothetical protein